MQILTPLEAVLQPKFVVAQDKFTALTDIVSTHEFRRAVSLAVSDPTLVVSADDIKAFTGCAALLFTMREVHVPYMEVPAYDAFCRVCNRIMKDSSFTALLRATVLAMSYMLLMPTLAKYVANKKYTKAESEQILTQALDTIHKGTLVGFEVDFNLLVEQTIQRVQKSLLSQALHYRSYLERTVGKIAKLPCEVTTPLRETVEYLVTHYQPLDPLLLSDQRYVTFSQQMATLQREYGWAAIFKPILETIDKCIAGAKAAEASEGEQGKCVNK